jgi:hypothetical protein
MAQKWLAAAIVFGCAVWGPSAKADVTYMLLDASDPTMVDLEFTVASQLSPAAGWQDFLSVSGYWGDNFPDGQVDYMLSSKGEPTLSLFSPAGFYGNFTFTGLPPNSVPGNGSFSGSGTIGGPRIPVLSTLGSAAISGVPAVPEPGTWVLLSLGFVGLAAAAMARRRPPALNPDLL